MPLPSRSRVEFPRFISNPSENDITSQEKMARRKLSLLELASELSNMSKACKVMGYPRQQFYEIRRNFQTYGAEGLIDRLPGANGPHPNRVSAEIEATILDHALAHPRHGSTRAEQDLRLKGIAVSAGGVRGVWQRHNLLTKRERLLRLEKATAERKIELSQDQIQLPVAEGAKRDRTAVLRDGSLAVLIKHVLIKQRTGVDSSVNNKSEYVQEKSNLIIPTMENAQFHGLTCTSDILSDRVTDVEFESSHVIM